MSPSITKLQRQLDLLAFLLGHRYPVGIDQIMEAVPDYAEGWLDADETTRASTRRKFERDKDDLKKLGIPLESVGFDIRLESGARDSTEGYLLREKDFYLPYLRLLRESDPESPGSSLREPAPAPTARGISPGFDIAEESLADALQALETAADIPDFPLRADARSGFRKLAFDVDPAAIRRGGFVQADPPDAGPLRRRLRTLSDALSARKRVSFRYHGIHRDEVSDREVAPYGLFLQTGHWYLVAHDTARDALRTFRLGRMDAVEPNSAKPGTPDFQVPEDFDLHDHVGREAWELGDDEGLDATVELAFPRSLWAERNHHGDLVETLAGGAQRRRFRVRQTDPFLRWVLSLAGDARIVDPPELRDALAAMAAAVIGAYDADGAPGPASSETDGNG